MLETRKRILIDILYVNKQEFCASSWKSTKGILRCTVNQSSNCRMWELISFLIFLVLCEDNGRVVLFSTPRSPSRILATRYSDVSYQFGTTLYNQHRRNIGLKQLSNHKLFFSDALRNVFVLYSVKWCDDSG